LLADSPTTKTTIVIIPGRTYPQWNNNWCSHLRNFSVGNPGIVDFYIEFVDMLFEHLKRRYSVFVGTH
jgi:hypothetical protein